MCLFRLLLSFILLAHNTGFSAEISVFVKTGDSVQLDILTQQLPQFDLLSWRKDKSDHIVRYNSDSKTVKYSNTSFKDRVYLNDKTFSLTVSNTQKTDSGLYTAKVTGDSEKDIEIYRVSVIDEVEAPVLTINSRWSSLNLCSFTCKESSMNISSIYNNSQCSQEEVTSAENTLRVSCSDDVILCNYSNPVSWKTEIKKVKDLCTLPQDISPEKEHRSRIILIVSLICLLALGLLVSVICFFIKKRQKEHSYNPGQQTDELTVYDKVGKPEKPLEMLEKSEGPTTVYDTVREHRLQDVTVETNTSVDQNTAEKSEPTSPVKQPKPETDNTIYAAVNKLSARSETKQPSVE